MAHSEWRLVGGRWRRKPDRYRRQILGTYRPPPTCVRCGAPTGGPARCEDDCQPRVSKQSKGDKT